MVLDLAAELRRQIITTFMMALPLSLEATGERRSHHTPYAFTRLPMGHPLTAGILQRFAQAVAAILHEKFGVSVLSYLDDWLMFAEQVPSDIQDDLRNLGITINYSKSILQPTPSLVYLGLLINVRQSLQPTTSCIAHTYA
jgi:hypothetical protein